MMTTLHLSLDYDLKKMNMLKWIFGILILISCTDKPVKEVRIVNQEELLNLVDTISIAINEEQLGQYQNIHIYEDNLIVGYNRFLHRFDVFNLETRMFSHFVQLDKKGPNRIPSVLFFIKINDDYIIKSGHFLSRVSSDGIIISKKPIEELEISKEGYTLQFRGMETLDYKKNSSRITSDFFIQPAYKYSADGDIDLSSYFMCTINYKDWASGIIEVQYPDEYVELHQKTGFLGSGHMIRNKHLLIYNFPVSNKVYVYNTKKQDLVIHDPVIQNRNDMKFDTNEIGGNPKFAQLSGQMFLPRYLGVEYDENNHTYYREHKSKARNNNIFQADYYLIKMDSNFNTIVQYNLGTLFRPRFQLHDGYLYFTPRDIDEEALHTLKLYRLKG
jgi:hypothetical protein